jgi:hypothetical protein
MSVDDLCDNPTVQLAETLVGKCNYVQIHDPVAKPTQRINANPRDRVSSPSQRHRDLSAATAKAIEWTSLAATSSFDITVIESFSSRAPSRTEDMRDRLRSEVDAVEGYDAVRW